MTFVVTSSFAVTASNYLKFSYNENEEKKCGHVHQGVPERYANFLQGGTTYNFQLDKLICLSRHTCRNQAYPAAAASSQRKFQA
jgi:hypothetical protein